MVWFGGCCELVPASVLVSVFSPGTLPCSTATSVGPFSMSDFASSSVEVSLLDHVLP
jgi:hypothetical protein